MTALLLADGTRIEGQSFGAAVDSEGEVVFNTGMVGYPDSLTDPSYRGQILTFTFPLIGNYGVPGNAKNAYGFSENFESENIHVRGVIVAQASEHHSHHESVSSLHNWLEFHKIPGITGVDTRMLTKKLREHGVMLGRIVQDNAVKDAGTIADPNLENLVGQVSIAAPVTYDPDPQEFATPVATVVAYDCGMKRNIIRSLLKRGLRVVRVPWDYNLAAHKEPFDALFISNGPGDPKQCVPTINSIKYAIDKQITTFGICLGNQLLALAIGGDTYKLKYGHRGCNQPCIEVCDDEKQCDPTKTRCIITSQNHGFAVSEELPKGWRVWYRNANDGTVEGIRHESGKFFSVQFHPEATPGPEDANALFDEFAAAIKR